MAMRIAIALVALLLALPAEAQLPPVSAPVASTAPEDADLALRLRPVDLRMTTEVRINGRGPFRFIVDTGANRTVVSRRLAGVLALPAVGRGRLTSTGGTAEVDLVMIGTLDLGGLLTRAIRAPALDEANLGAVGILGIDVLGDKTVVMDLVRDRMTVQHGRSARIVRDPDEIVVTARRRFGELVLVDADINGQKIYVVLDTGAAGTIGNLALKARLDRRSDIAAYPVTLLDVAGNSTPAMSARLARIRIGGVRVEGQPAAFADVETFRRFGLIDQPAMLLGMDLLRRFRRVSIDFATRRVRFLIDRP